MTKKILVLPGDGIGKEVMKPTISILSFLIEKYNLDYVISEMNVGGAAFDECGSPIPNNVLEEAKISDAILFGAVGGEKWDGLAWELRPENALLTLRKELNLFANLRPAFLFNDLSNASPLKKEIINDLDILIVRELTGGIYFGEPRGLVEDKDPNYAFNTMIYDEDEVKRIAKIAFESAQKRKGKLCSVDKANVLEVSKFWRSVITEMSLNYPDVELSHQLADNAAMQLVLDPNQFDVIVSSNLFGDILSDIAGTLTGSIGMLPSASLDNSFKGMYEPCHGSAPDIAGDDVANPIAMISSLSMALKFSLDEQEISSKIDTAIATFIQKGFRTKDITTDNNFIKTSEVADKIIDLIDYE